MLKISGAYKFQMVKFLDIFLSEIYIVQNFLQVMYMQLVKFLPTKLESDLKIYGIDLYHMYVLIKETKIFLSGDKKNKQVLIQVLA